jgi:hypothetical protein
MVWPMQDGSEAGKAVGRVMDVLAARDEDVGQPKPADRRPYSELPDRSRKWPKPIRLLFIAGSAAALWGLIFAGIRML